jgi:hypothetical protein
VVQARRLADFYERPFLEFLRRSLPPVKEPDLVPDFRRPRDARTLNAGQERDLKSVLAWAAAQRDNAIDLYDEIGEQPRAFLTSFMHPKWTTQTSPVSEQGVH